MNSLLVENNSIDQSAASDRATLLFLDFDIVKIYDYFTLIFLGNGKYCPNRNVSKEFFDCPCTFTRECCFCDLG